MNNLNLDFLKNQFIKSAYLGWQVETKSFKVKYKTEKPTSSALLKTLQNKLSNELGSNLPADLKTLFTLSSSIHWEWSTKPMQNMGKNVLFKEVLYNYSEIRVLFHWSIKETLDSLAITRKYVESIEQFSQEDIAELLEPYPFVKNRQITKEKLKEHLNNLIPVISLWNGDYLCMHGKSNEIFYLSHDPDDTVDGFGLSKLSNSLFELLNKLAEVGFLVDISQPKSLFSLYTDLKKWEDIKEIVSNVTVPQDFKDKYFSKKKLFGIF